MSPTEIRNEYRQSTKRVRTDNDDDFVIASPEIEEREYKRRYLTVVVSDGPRHVLRRPR